MATEVGMNEHAAAVCPTSPAGSIDADGFCCLHGWDCGDFAINHPTNTWRCPCGQLIRRYRGDDEVRCSCGRWFNSCGDELRTDWMENPSIYDAEIGDLEGFEIAQLRHEGGLRCPRRPVTFA